VPPTDNRAALRDFAAVLSIERTIAAERRKGSAGLSIFAFILGLLLFKKVAEKFNNVLASGIRRLGIISHGGATFDTEIIETGGLACITVDDHALRPFLEAAFAILGWRLRVPYRARDSLVVEKMIGARIFNNVYIGASFFQSRDVIAAWADRHPVVGDAVIKPDRLLTHLFVINHRGIAGRVETDIGGKARALRRVGAPEAIHARIKRGYGAVRETHNRNLVRIDARVLREHSERSKGVVHLRVGRKLRRIGNGVRNPTPCEAVGDKRGEARLVQLARPHAVIEADAARAMHEDDGWQPVGSGLQYAELARDRHGLAIFFSEQKSAVLSVTVCTG
jgi:hypothetical protein